ncbi:G2/M phase-specific E3 ubiquitin-protein ligase [Pelobates fuscus]|uniref:G2/M phase-specific E3 ubiquitin-protein ligase n=1 Tax=Pelobates fuscus TaxID=191477 RepID=UPI002FE454D8
MSQITPTSSMSLPCMLCGRQDDCPEKYGEKKTLHNLTLHYNCLLLSSGIWQRGEEDEGLYGFLLDDIKKEVNRAKKMKCCLCKNRGASIGCVTPRCKKSYHYPCGVEKECIFQFTESFRSYCWDHRPVQLVTSSQVGGSSHCTICLENIEHTPSYHVLHSPCCKSSWFHRDCLQYQALSAGLHFFRCSVCNNKDKFQNEMLRMGIHIPERDASWELEENAFHELLERYQHCDVEMCICPNGREFNKPDSKWEILRCQCCGSKGTHLACSSLMKYNHGWDCTECKNIVCTPGKRSRPGSLTPSETRGHLGYGLNQPSPKSPRKSVVVRPIHTISGILQDLRLQLCRNPMYLLVKKESIWDSSVKAFRKYSFSPFHTIHVKYKEFNLRKANQERNVSTSEYFHLLLKSLENSILFEGSERKNLSMHPDAQRDNLYFEAGRMIAVALVHGGPAPGFFSRTLFYCLIYEPQHVQPILDDVVDPDVLQAIRTIQSCHKRNSLQSAVNQYFEYLQNTGSLRLVHAVSDKVLLVNDILAYHVIRRVQQQLESFKLGLKTLGVLEKIQAHPTAFWSVLCMKQEKLTAKLMADLFTVAYPEDIYTNRQSDTCFWIDYLEDTEEGSTAVSLENILVFVTGLDSIPPAGFNPPATVHFSHRAVPTADRKHNCLKLPILPSYIEFRRSLDQAICKTLQKV